MIERELKTCSYCGQELPVEEFIHGTNKMCKKCKAKMNSEYRKKRMANPNDPYRENERIRAREYYHTIAQKNAENFLNQYKTACQACVVESNPCVIVFHHINPKDKKFNLGEASLQKKHTIAEIEDEISKCICLCANCHSEFHHVYGYAYKDPETTLQNWLAEKWKENFG